MQVRRIVVPVQYGGVSKVTYRAEILFVYDKGAAGKSSVWPTGYRRISWLRILPGQSREGSIYPMYLFTDGSEQIDKKTNMKHVKADIVQHILLGWVKIYDYEDVLARDGKDAYHEHIHEPQLPFR